MSSCKSDTLFQLIKSLTKAEKRHFKLYIGRDSHGQSAKYLKLFDVFDGMAVFDETMLLRKKSWLNTSQLANLKTVLYQSILESLRVLNSGQDTDIYIRDCLNNITILYNKGLYEQCARELSRTKKEVQRLDKSTVMYELLRLEKQIASTYVKGHFDVYIGQLIQESEEVKEKLSNINQFNNLALQFSAKYLKTGFIRSSADVEAVNKLFNPSLLIFDVEYLSLDERLYLYSFYVEYYFLMQEFHQAHFYATKWVDLFSSQELMFSKLESYVKGLNSLLKAQEKLHLYKEYESAYDKLKQVPIIFSKGLTFHMQVNVFKYTALHQINRCFMTGEFTLGRQDIPPLFNELEKFSSFIDQQDVLVFYYKFACMYFGAGDFKQSIFWLNKIINSKEIDVRSDIHSFTRLVNLICHYELGHLDHIEYLIVSTYRRLLKHEDFYLFQRFILDFLKKLSSYGGASLVEEFKVLKNKLIPLEKDSFEKRAFIYFDIISWLDSKIQNKPVEEIVREKFLKQYNQ